MSEKYIQRHIGSHHVCEGHHHDDDEDDGGDDMTRQDDGHAHYNTTQSAASRYGDEVLS